MMKIAKLFAFLLLFDVVGRGIALRDGPEGRRTPGAEQATSAAGLAVSESAKRQQRRIDRLMPAGTAGRAKAVIILIGELIAKAKEDQASSRRPQDQVREFDGWVRAEIKRQFGSLTTEQTQLLSLHVVGKLLESSPRGKAMEQQKLEMMLQELNQLTRGASALLSKDDETIRSILAKIE
jgi:hypothetical protein